MLTAHSICPAKTLYHLHGSYEFIFCHIYGSYNFICITFMDLIQGLVQERRNSSTLAMKLHLSCINMSLWFYLKWKNLNLTALFRLKYEKFMCDKQYHIFEWLAWHHHLSLVMRQIKMPTSFREPQFFFGGARVPAKTNYYLNTLMALVWEEKV